MQIDSIIGELLLRNNCVVVPKFGGFIATQTSATIDYVSGKMLPPKKSILFNKQLTNNDGLLLSTYASKYNCSYEEASELIENQVKEWFESLNQGTRITIDKVGFIYLDNEKNVRFEQDRFFNLLLQSFGMTQVQFVPEEQVVKEEVKERISVPIERTETPVITLIPEIKPLKRTKELVVEHVAENKIIAPETKTISITSRRTSKKLVRYIAAACILPIAFYSVWIPTKTDVLESGMFSIQDFNPFHKEKSEQYNQLRFKTKFTSIPKIESFEELTAKLPADVSVFPLEIENDDLGEENDIFYVRLKADELIQAPEEATVDLTDVKTETVSSNKSGKYKVIVGSFSNDNNANSLMNDLKEKGFTAFTYPESNGLIRVVAGSSNSSAEASSLVSKLSELQISSWILK